VEYVGIDSVSKRAAWCALDAAGELLGEGLIPADLEARFGRRIDSAEPR